MAKIFNFPRKQISEQDKKIIKLESYIKTNLLELANYRKELLKLAKAINRPPLVLLRSWPTSDSSK